MMTYLSGASRADQLAAAKTKRAEITTRRANYQPPVSTPEPAALIARLRALLSSSNEREAREDVISSIDEGHEALTQKVSTPYRESSSPINQVDCNGVDTFRVATPYPGCASGGVDEEDSAENCASSSDKNETTAQTEFDEKCQHDTYGVDTFSEPSDLKENCQHDTYGVDTFSETPRRTKKQREADAYRQKQKAKAAAKRERDRHITAAEMKADPNFIPLSDPDSWSMCKVQLWINPDDPDDVQAKFWFSRLNALILDLADAPHRWIPFFSRTRQFTNSMKRRGVLSPGMERTVKKLSKRNRRRETRGIPLARIGQHMVYGDYNHRNIPLGDQDEFGILDWVAKANGEHWPIVWIVKGSKTLAIELKPIVHREGADPKNPEFMGYHDPGNAYLASKRFRNEMTRGDRRRNAKKGETND